MKLGELTFSSVYVSVDFRAYISKKLGFGIAVGPTSLKDIKSEILIWIID